MTMPHKIGQPEVFEALDSLTIPYRYYESPHDFIDEDDMEFWKQCGAVRCKNLFLRNHKGDRHFLVIAPFYEPVSIFNLEQHFKKGKISFASDERLQRVLHVTPGAVSVFGLLNDKNHETTVFIDDRLPEYPVVSFLPNQRHAIITLSFNDFIRFVEYTGNNFSYINLST